MTQDLLFLIVTALTGVYTSRWTSRLAPLGTELPLKTISATVLAGLVPLLAFSGVVLSGALLWLTLIYCGVYVFGPVLLVGVARAGRYGLAGQLADLFYWTEAGRAGLRRLLAQVALQKADAGAALKLLDSSADPLMLAQAYAIERRWQDVLELELPEEGDNSFLAEGARIRALIGLNRLHEASDAVEAMRMRWEAQGQGPIGYRSLKLSEARLNAEWGRFEAVRETFQDPLPGLPPFAALGLLARAAEQSGRLEQALELYAQAYVNAPEGLSEAYAEPLERHGRPLPERKRREARRAYGSYALLVAIVIAYVVQLLLENRYGPNAATFSAAYLLNISGVPEADALWRFLSYAFVHGNLVHIGFNAWVLVDIGRLYEQRRGWGNLLAAFVFGTVMGAYLTQVAQAGTQLALVGASGGILGIAGALLADTWRGTSTQDRYLTRSLMQWMVIIVLFSLAIPNVSLWGHVGGVVGGLLWGFIRQGLPRSSRIDLFAGGFSIGLMVYALLEVGSFVLRYVV